MLTAKDELEHAWRYFALHAAQRMTMFNYFLVLFGLTAAGLAGSLQGQGALRWGGVVLGVALSFVSYTFYKLDERTSFLIKSSEAALRSLEHRLVSKEGQLFSDEAPGTEHARALRGLWTYGRCFRLVFLVSASAGIIGAALAVGLLLSR